MKIQGDYSAFFKKNCKYVLEGDEVSGLYLNFEKNTIPENYTLGLILDSKYGGREAHSLF